MKKGLLIVLIVMVATAITAIAQVKPDWVTKSPGWVDGDIVFGVGKAPKMTNSSLQRSIAANRARAGILKVVGLKVATLKGSEVVEIWQDDNGDLYALAKVVKAGITE